MAQSVLHKAASRGIADHGWLKSYHSFSFGGYYNPERMHFGLLRVLNDDTVSGGMGFGTHPHDNMEIVSIPLEGDLEHKDSMGTVATIKHGDVQIMSAGTGIEHSEYNKNKDKPVKFLQIWIFPAKKNITPRYDQVTLKNEERHNRFQQIVSPDKTQGGVMINQEAWLHIAKCDKDTFIEYTLKKKGNGVYVFVLSGDVEVDGQQLHPRDGFGIWDTEKIGLRAASETEVLLIEVPMK
ncbi:MAG: yhhW 2 [Bacteroidetes bacterium]|nr:yhhW 2 [Bacteroidota bacterium]